MVSSPQPEIVHNYISAVYLDHHVGLDLIKVRPTNSGKDVVHGAWVLRISIAAARSPYKQFFCQDLASLEQDARDSDSINVGDLQASFSSG